MKRQHPRGLKVRPNPTSSLIAGIVSLVFVLFGVFMAIPNAGPIGVIWTLAAAVVSFIHFYNAFSTNGIATEIIELPSQKTPTTPESRLRRLDDLHNKSLITDAEYLERRTAILREL